MAWIALTCPQCSAPLPRVALWRSVKCGACGSLITKTEEMVERAKFREARARAVKEAEAAAMGTMVSCGGQRYRLLQLLGGGNGSQVHLARSAGPFPFSATIKISQTREATARHEKEAVALKELCAPLHGGASLYAARCLPELMAFGKVDGDSARHGLVLRHPYGYWGSLAALGERFPSGIDPRHAVWIWRRMLDTLHFLHTLGWVHGDLRPEHALVHPRDHAVRLIGLGEAVRNAGRWQKAEDLRRSALIIQALGGASSNLPPELASLMGQVAEDADFCEREGARGLDIRLKSAARDAFGPPSFVHLRI